MRFIYHVFIWSTIALLIGLEAQCQLVQVDQVLSPIEIEVGDLFKNENIHDITRQDNGLVWILGRKELYYAVNEGVFAYSEIDIPVGHNQRFLVSPSGDRTFYFTTNAIVELSDLQTPPKVTDLTQVLGLSSQIEVREVEFESNGKFLIITGVDERRQLWRFDSKTLKAKLLSSEIGRMWDMLRIDRKWVLTGKGITTLTYQDEQFDIDIKDVSHLPPKAQQRLDIIAQYGQEVYLKSGEDQLLVYDLDSDSVSSFATDEAIIDLWINSAGEIRILLADQRIINRDGKVILDFKPSLSDPIDRLALEVDNSSICVQLENTTWISCKKGFYLINEEKTGFDLYQVKQKTGRITNVHEDIQTDRTYLLTAGRGLFIYERSSGKFIKSISTDENGKSLNCFKWRFLEGRFFIYGAHGLYEFIKNTETIDFLVSPYSVADTILTNRFNTFEVHKDLKEVFLGTKDGNLIRYNPNTGQETLYPFSKDNPASRNLVYEIDVLPNGDLIILTELGFFVFSISEERLMSAKQRWSAIPAQVAPQLSGVRVISDSTFLISSFGDGLQVFDFEQDSLYRPVIDAFPTSNISDIFFDDLENVYGSTHQGMINYHVPTNTSRLLSTDHGLPAEDIHYRYMNSSQSGNMFLGLIESYVAFKSEQIRSTETDDFLLHAIQVNGKKVKFSNKPGQSLDLKHSQNNIRMDIVSFFKNGIAPKVYESRLVGLHDDWRLSSIKEPIQYDALAAGDYRFEFRGQNSEATSLPFHFRVKKPYWEEAWFILSILALVGAILVFIFGLRSKYLRKEAELKAKHEIELAQLEMKSLRAQMNPHFLFNSLNSIKSFIAQNEPRTATRYLTKFSHLIRAILNNSRESEVSLAQELKALALYIDLEQLRFENSFEYNVKVSEEIDLEEILVPPLILQPYVENAIWHGLLHKDGNRKLDIELAQADGGIVAIVRDNGVGRAAAGLLKSKTATKHKSLGMAITEDRIRMAQQNEERMGVEILDLIASDGLAIGTEVRVQIPLTKQPTHYGKTHSTRHR